MIIGFGRKAKGPIHAIEHSWSRREFVAVCTNQVRFEYGEMEQGTSDDIPPPCRRCERSLRNRRKREDGMLNCWGFAL